MIYFIINKVESVMESSVFTENKMIEEDKSEVMVKTMDDDSLIVGKTHSELDLKLQDEEYGGESDDEKNKKDENELEYNAASASNLSKNKWTSTLEEVQPILPILFHVLPSRALRYKLIINKFKAVISDLPSSRNLLPSCVKLSKSTIKILQKEKKDKVWENYTNSEALEKLENSLKLLFSHMVSVSIELKIDSDIIKNEAKYVLSEKQDDERINIPAGEENDEGENKLKTNDRKFDKSENKWIKMLEVQPIAPILLKKFPDLASRYEFFFDSTKRKYRAIDYICLQKHANNIFNIFKKRRKKAYGMILQI